MPKDKFKATWVSHSSMGDFLKCPRLYYLHNVYKDPSSYHKVNLINPALALGQVVHNVLESLSSLKAEERFSKSLLESYDNEWEAISGKLGGFKNESEEAEYKERGAKMLQTVMDNPGPLLKKTIKISQNLPYYWISEDENIILCGKVDWLEYIEEDDSVHIIDFKTGKHEEKEDSLQLPIYNLLVTNCQKRNVSKLSYWYIDSKDTPTQQKLPGLEESYDRVFEVAKKVKQARSEGLFECPRGGCYACEPFEAIVNGEAERVGVGAYNQDIYVMS